MILTDTGPLVALVNRNDPNHAQCIAAAKRLPAEPLVTTWPCFTEAMYLVHRAGGYPAQVALWELWRAGRLRLHMPAEAEIAQMVELMRVYRDIPMDLADASIVAAADSLAQRRVFSLDRHFFAYQVTGGSGFEVVP